MKVISSSDPQGFHWAYIKWAEQKLLSQAVTQRCFSKSVFCKYIAASQKSNNVTVTEQKMKFPTKDFTFAEEIINWTPFFCTASEVSIKLYRSFIATILSQGCSSVILQHICRTFLQFILCSSFHELNYVQSEDCLIKHLFVLRI